jgi:hypothetical protein
MANSLEFFCTADDIRTCLKAAEATQALRYYRVDAPVPDVPPEESVDACSEEIDGHAEMQLLMAREGVHVRARKVQPSGSDAGYAFDQLENPDTVMMHFGLRKAGLLTRGTVSTLGKTAESRALFLHFAKHFKKSCTKVQAYWVGPEALSLLRSGYRFTTNETASRAYDLRETD